MTVSAPAPVVDRTAEAVIFSWALVSDRRDAARLRRPVSLMSEHGVDVAVVSRFAAPVVARNLRVRPPGPGRLFIYTDDGSERHELTRTGLRQAGPSADGHRTLLRGSGRGDAMRDFLEVQAGRGVGPGLVFVVDDRDEHAPDTLLVAEAARAVVIPFRAGGSTLGRLLDDQVVRRRMRRPPDVDPDPDWVVVESGIDPLRHRISESLFTLGAAGFGTRGAVEEDGPFTVPGVLCTGVYTGTGAGEHLLPCPVWSAVDVEPPPREDLRTLDLRTGVLVRTETGTDTIPLRSMRFMSCTRPGIAALRVEGAPGRVRPGAALRASIGADITSGRLGSSTWARSTSELGGGVVAVAAQRRVRKRDVDVLERIAAYASDRPLPPRLGVAIGALEAAEEAGWEAVLAEHRLAWADRWNHVDVRIPDDRAAQLALRFALFHLWSNADRHDELAVGARGLSGSGYAGHVFWDADAFVLPALVSIDPGAAGAMVRYRQKRLDAAVRLAAASGHDGARFPWESASAGNDVTPTSGTLGSDTVAILTGAMEEHVTADVAWAAVHHARWTGHPATSQRNHLALLSATARYWASRVRADSGGALHIDGVIGPDEYHEGVDDNAFTNVMARWNLSQAAELAERAGDVGPAAHWRDIAERLVDGYDPATGRYEQFRGYFALEPLTIAEVARPPVAADLLLGRARVARSQLIKQPDVLMLHHLVPEAVAAGSLAPNLDFYGPRTAHGSSLSPAVSAGLLARAGRPEEALALFRVAACLDLDDATGMTAAGLHLANLAGLWQAMLTGFAGVNVSDGVMTVDPQLPVAWRSVEVRFRCLGRRVRLAIDGNDVQVTADAALPVRVGGGPTRSVGPRREPAS
jgi:trehalose/maltose hydrolase-like predicted phosphorylase